jgi:hypothetical protein
MSDRVRTSRAWGWLAAVVSVVGLCAGGCVALSSSFGSLGSNSGSSLPPAPPAKDFGTAREVGTRGDGPNPRAVYHGAFPSDDETQERSVGGLPARFSGYTTWVRSVRRVPASRYVDGLRGSYLRVRATVFNRDTEEQHVCACDFSVWTESNGYREADAVRARVLAEYATMRSGKTREGEVYLYVGTVEGPYFVVYDPDAHFADASSTARGVWQVNASDLRSTPTGPRSTTS